MHIEVRIDCSANEFRRLRGQPDLLPLIELAGVAMERWLQQRVLAADPTRAPEPPPGLGGCRRRGGRG